MKRSRLAGPSMGALRARLGAGFTIIEFMIAITLSLLVMAAMSAAFVANSRSRTEIERANQQVENGRYALQILSDDLQQAGYLSYLNLANVPDSAAPNGLPPPTSKPGACLTTVAAFNAALKIHVQGYDNLTALDSTLTPCLSDFKSRTDIVVVRRAATCVSAPTADPNCAMVAGAPYFQASLCADELNQTDPSNYFRLDTNTANLNRTARDCTTTAQSRQFMTNIYFVANNDVAGDGIPTLKRAELGAVGGTATFTIVPIAQGIENLQVEYGIDTDNDGAPNAYSTNPDIYGGATSCDSACVNNWRNVVSMKLTVLSRNTTTTRDFTDTKTYTLPGVTVGPVGDHYKRHVYQTSVRLMNPAGRREIS